MRATLKDSDGMSTAEVIELPTPDINDPRALGVLTEAKLLEWNIQYRYEPEFALDKLEVVESTQAREAEDRIDPEMVEEYRQHMAAGVVFPPIVVMDPNMVIDGNTRRGAAEKNRMKTLPAFVARFPSTALARAFAAAMNQKNGRRLSTHEAQAAALALLDADYTEESVAREIGYSRTQVQKWRAEQEFTVKAQRVGLHNADEVKKTQRIQLSAISSDPVFAEAVKAVTQVNPKGSAVTELVREVKQAHSESEALQKVADLKASWIPAGPPPHRPTAPPALKSFRMSAPNLLKNAANPADYLEVEESRREVAVEMWRQLRTLADQVLGLYGSRSE